MFPIDVAMNKDLAIEMRNRCRTRFRAGRPPAAIAPAAIAPAAIANAAHHAHRHHAHRHHAQPPPRPSATTPTGHQVRRLPIRIEDVL